MYVNTRICSSFPDIDLTTLGCTKVIHIHIYTHIHIHTHTHSYTHIHTHTLSHTLTHTQTNKHTHKVTSGDGTLSVVVEVVSATADHTNLVG
jgi:hypothetical protein